MPGLNGGLALACAALMATTANAADEVRIEAGAPVRIIGAAPADAYVEARFRPMTAGDGKLYVVGRYQDEANWYGAGLAYQPAMGRMRIEIVRMKDGQVMPLKQFGRAAATDGRPHTVRLEMSGSTLTAYLDGERITAVVDDGLPLPGRYGVVATGAAFEASTPVTGDAALKPARLALARAPQQVQLAVGDAAVWLPVSALGPFRLPQTVPVPASRFLTQSAVQDGAAAATGARAIHFNAATANPGLLHARVEKGGVMLTPRAAGATTVTLTSADDPNVFTVVDVAIAAVSKPAGAGYRLAGAVTPRIAERDVPADTPLRLRFDGVPALGTSGGAIRVFRKRDGMLADTIRTSGEADRLGYAGQPFRRALRLQPIVIEGNEAIVHLHSAKLQPGEAYVMTVDAGVFEGTVAGQPFKGIAREQGWTFGTRQHAPRGTRLVVDDDGPADFRTVQGALNHAMQSVSRSTPVTVDIRNGRYQEQLYLRSKDNVTLRGESRDGVVIEARNSDGINPGSGTAQEAHSPGITGGRALFLIEDADMVTLDTLTLRNSTLRATPTGGQAETLFFNSEGRLVAKNASFYSEQDTVQVRGYAWFYRSLVAGNVDFIWGNNRAALFEQSELRTVGDSGNATSGGYLLQARTVSAQDRGFMFVQSRLTHGPGPNGNDVPAGATWLARSPGYANTWDHVAFIDCRMGPHIAAAGWSGPGTGRQPAPNPLAASATAGWREYGTMDLDGQPLDLSRRVHGRVLTAEEAKAAYSTRAAFFAGFDGGKGWDPQP